MTKIIIIDGDGFLYGWIIGLIIAVFAILLITVIMPKFVMPYFDSLSPPTHFKCVEGAEPVYDWSAKSWDCEPKNA